MVFDVYFLFNKKTKKFIGYSVDPKALTGDLLWRRRQLKRGESITDYVWKGDYETGKMIRKDESPAIVSEIDVREKFYNRLHRKYSLEEFNTTIMLQLDRLIQMVGRKKTITPEFEEMLSFFKRNYEKMLSEIQFYKDSDDHEYKSQKRMRKEIKDQFEV